MSWDEGNYGHPCINDKRPFGNGNWEYDILKMIGEEPVMIDGEKEYTDEQRDKAVKLFNEMPEVIRQLATERMSA